MTNLDSILKSRDITLSTKVRLVKAVACPVVMYGCESRTIKKAEGEKRVEPPENLDVKLNQQLFHTYVEEAFSSVQLLGRVRLCDPMDCSTPGLPVHHQLPELARTHVLQVSDAIQPSQPLSSPSPPALNLSQHQGLFQ